MIEHTISTNEMQSAEGAKFQVLLLTEGSGESLTRLEVGIRTTMPDGQVHDLRLVPASSTDEEDLTAAVFLYEDDEAVAHFAWKPKPTPKMSITIDNHDKDTLAERQWTASLSIDDGEDAGESSDAEFGDTPGEALENLLAMYPNLFPKEN